MPPIGLPRDPAQWLAIALALVAIAAGGRILRPSPRRSLFAAIAALAAAALSAAYIAVYLRGGPRIIDATSYYLEARAIAHGLFAWPISTPATSTLGRFLVRADGPAGQHVAVIFPPGYPALLAAGFLAGAPLAVGPILAAGIAWITCDLAASVAGDRDGAISVPRLAVVFSVVCAALRYHTADTMSHGLAALCASGAIALVFRARDAIASPRRSIAFAAAAGLLAGWLAATRPASSVALAVVLGAAIAMESPWRDRLRLGAAIAIGAIPGLALLLAHQRAATGILGGSSQQLYYALSDGPPGCFRYGFGRGIGCVGEHGDFVRAHLADGFGFIAAAGTTLRRLKAHLVDPLNLEPLALLVPIGAWVGRKTPRVRLLAIAVVAQIAAYVPFYFDGNYPAGGGRFFADVLPVEHVLAAIAVAHLARRKHLPDRWAAGAIAAALLGFAFRAGFDHAKLRDRDGGLPMFEPARLASAGISRGIVFFDTDHGFNLAFDPAAPSGGVEAARFHGDDLDRMIWEAKGRPPAFRYRFGIPAAGPATIAIEPLAMQPISRDPLTIEGESLWPPLDQRGGYALPEYASGTCASAGRWLRIHAEGPGVEARVRVDLPASFTAGTMVSTRVALGSGARGEVVLIEDDSVIRRWAVTGNAGPDLNCLDLDGVPISEGARTVVVELRRGSSKAGEDPIFALDRILLSPKKSIDR